LIKIIHVAKNLQLIKTTFNFHNTKPRENYLYYRFGAFFLGKTIRSKVGVSPKGIAPFGETPTVCGIFPIDIASIGKMPHIARLWSSETGRQAAQVQELKPKILLGHYVRTCCFQQSLLVANIIIISI